MGNPIDYVILTAVSALISCGRPAAVEERTSSRSAPLAGQPAPAPRAFDLIPQIPSAQGPGTDRPAVTFYTPHITKGSRFDVKDLDVIVSRASFVRSGGERLAARADEASPQAHPEQGHFFVLTPVSPLIPRGGDELQIVEDDAIRVLAPPRDHAVLDGRRVYRLSLLRSVPSRAER